MKKLKTILLILTLLFCTYTLPTVKAKDKINLYLFYGEGCPHCEEFMKYLDGLDETQKAKFNLVKNEVWYDENNQKLMESVAQTIGDDEVSGVPYIIIGKKTFSGYSESSNEEIQSAIDEALKSDYDVMNELGVKGKSKSSSNDTVLYLSIGIIVIGVVGLLIYTKKSVK